MFKKFGGKDGLVKALDSRYVKGCKEDIGIQDQRDIIKNKMDKFRVNIYPGKEVKSIMDRLYDSLGDSLLKILIFGAVLSTIIGLQKNGTKGLLEGFMIIFTFVLISILDAISTKYIEKNFTRLMEDRAL